MADPKRIYLMIISPVIISIVTLGYLLHRERQQRRQDKITSAHEHARIRKIAEQAASDAASCVAVIDRLDTSDHPFHLRAVRSHRTEAN
jgi:hypothetical protein